MPKDFVQAIQYKTFDAANLDGTFKAINEDGLEKACFLIRIVNDSNTDITISYDKTNNHDFLRAQSDLQLPFQSNSQPNNNRALIRKGTVVYAKGTAGIGTIYLIGYYQEPS